MSAQQWWEMKGASERYAQLLQAKQEPPLFLYLVWADYGRLANEIAAARKYRSPDERSDIRDRCA